MSHKAGQRTAFCVFVDLLGDLLYSTRESQSFEGIEPCPQPTVERTEKTSGRQYRSH